MADTPDLTISSVTVVDGSGAPAFVASVDVRGDRITAVRTSGEAPAEAAHVIDGSGLTLAPGFIDVHCHDDYAVLVAPDHPCKTLQGVTSVVNGNCGMSPAPENEMVPGAPTFPRFADYFDRLESDPPAVNVATLVGHGAIRSGVMGLRTDRHPSRSERTQMAADLETALNDGVIGLSSGLAYEPGCYSDVAEMSGLAQQVADVGGIYTTHMRNEADDLLDSIEESIAVAEASGVRLQISHLKAGGRNNWGAVVDALQMIDEARGRGVDVMADQYPYTRGSTLLDQIIVAGGLDGASAFGGMSTDQVQIAAAPGHPEWEGRTITEIAVDAGIAPREMADRILDAEGRACIVVVDMMSDDDVATVLRHPTVMIGSDGIPVGDKPHPRLSHTFPRVLGRFVREQQLLDLPTAVHRMTGMPAARFGFTGRGVIEPGAFADLVLFDAEAIVDTGTYAEPNSVPEGIAGVWVNGERVAEHGEVTGARPGRVVRRA